MAGSESLQDIRSEIAYRGKKEKKTAQKAVAADAWETDGSVFPDSSGALRLDRAAHVYRIHQR
jgi:hypothetical protein